MRIFAIVLFAFAALTLATPAFAEPVPDSALQMRVLSRDGETFVVEVANRSDNLAHFDGIGLYFIPTAEEAPQRLGVVASGQIETQGTWKDAPSIVDVAPHQTIKVKLDSYCLDQQRESPKATVSYHLASRRMPAELMIALAGSARTIASTGYDPELKGSSNQNARRVTSPAQVSSLTQAAIWRIRTAMPMPLQGEVRPTTHRSSESRENRSVEY
jgi:hypothetical protein